MTVLAAFVTFDDVKEAVAIFLQGGWVMMMLALIGGILYTVAFSAFIYVTRGGLSMKHRHEWAAWIRRPSKGQGRAGEAIRYAMASERLTVKSVRRRFMEMRAAVLNTVDRRLLVVNTLVAAAPLAGLLGTVIGMLAMFAALSGEGGASGMEGVSKGMSEALITTQTGLTIALPGLFLALIVKRKRNDTERAFARIESMILTTQFSPEEVETISSDRAQSEVTAA